MAVWGASHNAWLCHRHGDASLNDGNGGQGVAWGGWDGPERAIFDLHSQSGKRTGSYVTLNRPGLSSNHNESCLERVCCLLAAYQVFAEC